MLELIRRMGVFLIVMQTMYHFVSGSKYAHYIRLLMRIMTLAILIVPLLDLLREGTEDHFSDKLAQFERQYEEILEGAQPGEIGGADEQISAKAGGEIRETFNPVLSAYGYEIAEVEMTQEQIRFYLVPAGEGGGIVIEPVGKISVGGAGNQNESAGEEGEGNQGKSAGNTRAHDAGEKERELRDVIAEMLGAEKERVEVNILG